jgi:hypothetical protein
MNRFRGAILATVIGIGGVVVPAEKSEAGLISWLRCVINPCRWPCSSNSCAPACEVPSCPPVVQEGSYCNPCAQPQPCPVSYVRRSYMEPRTRMTTQSVLESRPTYVRRRYWDPCSVCYKTYYECTTSLVRRSYCVPVTEYVERSYLEPVTTCPTPSCPTACPAPASTEDVPPPPSVTQTGRPITGDRLLPGLRPRGANRSTPSGRETNRVTVPSAQRSAPLALNSDRLAAY